MRGLVKRSLTMAVLISLCLGSRSFGEVDHLRERALNLYRVMDYRGALTLFLRVAEANPEEGAVWDYAGWCHRYQGDWEKALACFDRALPLLPGEAGAWVAVGMGETYLGAADYDKARSSFSEAINRAPEDEELLLRSLRGIVWSCAFSGDDRGFEKALNAISELNGDMARAVRNDLSTVLERVKKEKKTVREQESKPKPVKKAPPKKASVESAPDPADRAKSSFPDRLACDFSPGSPIAKELAELSKRGGRSKRSDGFDAKGLIYYGITPPDDWSGDGWIPRKPAVSVVVDEFEDKVLRVSVTGIYGVREDPVSTGMTLFDEAMEGIKPFYGDPAYIKKEGVSMEALWHVSHGRMGRLGVEVMLDGSVKVQLAVTDRVIFGRFLIHSQKNN
ncbi:tetratricopeptide repeat protein [Dethiosulfovibrio sp. F2B]|uniref:tetratricopeptide repeat protein n=1 Tax=Dethiosulfovibrio faecalis TaxID=2720018 RepID=UPI001F38EC27|nr:tetratricopeptide repeat protein [Dethiosulfovibrio faecalis]MCF4152408.1 tetratricopeptide repeat protein [Dethiosulfovibrio faecalis]